MIKEATKTLIKSKGIIEKNALKDKKKKHIIKSKKAYKTPKSIRLISIDVGEKYINIVEGKYKKDKVIIDKLIKIKTPENALLDGEIHSNGNLASKIKNALNKLNVKTKQVVFTNTSQGIICREIIVPFVEDSKELQTLVEYEVQQFLPINLTEYIVQFSVIENLKLETIEKVKLFVVIYPKRKVKSYLKLSEDLGLKAHALDINSNAIKKLYSKSNLISGFKIDKEEIAFFIDLGAETIDITILNKGKLQFIRTLPYGGENLTINLAKKLEITLEEAEIIKKKEIDLEEIDISSNVLNIATAIIDEWLEEINKVIQFFFNNNHKKENATVYLYGGSSNLRGLISYMKEKLNLPVVKVEYLDCIELNKGANFNTIEEYLNAIGSLIRL